MKATNKGAQLPEAIKAIEERLAVLIVEDDDIVRTMVNKTLTREGYKVILASSGQEAIKLFKDSAEKIGLLITDIVMPQMDGQTLAEQLRVIQPDLKVLFMSGYTADYLEHRNKNTANVPLISKPFSIVHLRDVVSQLLPR